MARKLFHLSLLGVVLVAGAASYAVRRNLGASDGRPMDCARRWLDLSNKQCRNIQSNDPDFRQEAQALSLKLQEARQTMATLVADMQTSDDTLSEQAEVVLDAHHALMRRSMRHLMVVREYADVSQGVRLNTLCSNAMRCGEGRGPGPRHAPGGERCHGGGNPQAFWSQANEHDRCRGAPLERTVPDCPPGGQSGLLVPQRHLGSGYR